MVTTLYALIAVVSMYGVSRYLYGGQVAFFTMLLILAVPPISQTSFVLLSRQVLGEMPALALISLGLWVWFLSWERKEWVFSLIAGLAIGLGLISKMQTSVIILPAIMLIVFIRTWGKGMKKTGVYWIPVLISIFLAVGWISIQKIGSPDGLQM